MNQAVPNFAASLTTKLLGDLGGSRTDFNKLLNFLRGRNELLKSKIVGKEKRTICTECSGVEAERSIAAKMISLKKKFNP